MCYQGKTLISGYLDALEEYDRRHLMLVAAFRTGDPDGIEGFRSLAREAELTFRAARGRFQDHQKAHNCCKAIHFEEASNESAIIARRILQAGSQSSAAS
jgi:hypothetical protein